MSGDLFRLSAELSGILFVAGEAPAYNSCGETHLSPGPATEANMGSRARQGQAGELGPSVQLGFSRESDQGKIILVAPVSFVQNKVALRHLEVLSRRDI